MQILNCDLSSFKNPDLTALRLITDYISNVFDLASCLLKKHRNEQCRLSIYTFFGLLQLLELKKKKKLKF